MTGQLLASPRLNNPAMRVRTVALASPPAGTDVNVQQTDISAAAVAQLPGFNIDSVQVISFAALFVASAAVATRTIVAQYLGSNRISFVWPARSTLAASGTARVSVVPGFYGDSTPGTTGGQIMLGMIDPCLLNDQDTGTLRIATTGIQAGDQWSSLVVTFAMLGN